VWSCFAGGLIFRVFEDRSIGRGNQVLLLRNITISNTIIARRDYTTSSIRG
jgi:hypothetical protein